MMIRQRQNRAIRGQDSRSNVLRQLRQEPAYRSEDAGALSQTRWHGASPLFRCSDPWLFPAAKLGVDTQANNVAGLRERAAR